MKRLSYMSLLKTELDIIRANKLKIDQIWLNPFYKDYLDMFKGKSEAAPEYILTTLFATLGAAISTNRYIFHAQKKIFPNFWILLSGKSSTMRKSTALSLGMKLTEKYHTEHPDIYLYLPLSSSTASLMEIFNEQKHGIFKHDEIATFLAMMKKGYNIELKSIFTQLFDVPEIFPQEFKKNGITQIHNPFFCIATASTLDWIKQHIKGIDLKSGFMARFLFCHQEEKSALIPFPEKISDKAFNPLIKKYNSIYSLDVKEILIEEDFKSLYYDFYFEVHNFMSSLNISNGLDANLSRLLVDYFFKFSILEAVLLNRLVLTKIDAERARYLTVYYMAQAIEIITALDKTKLSDLESRILELIRDNPDITKSKIYQHFNNRLLARDLNRSLAELEKLELIYVSSKIGKKTTYRVISQ